MRSIPSEDFWDIALAILLVAVAWFTLAEFADARPPRYEPLGPTFLPRALSYCFLAMAGALLLKLGIRSRLRSRRAREQATAPGYRSTAERESPARESSGGVPAKVRPWLVVFAIALTAVYIRMLNIIGFRLGTLIFIPILGLAVVRHEPNVQRRRFVVVLAVLSVVLSQVLYFVFTGVLGVRVP